MTSWFMWIRSGCGSPTGRQFRTIESACNFGCSLTMARIRHWVLNWRIPADSCLSNRPPRKSASDSCATERCRRNRSLPKTALWQPKRSGFLSASPYLALIDLIQKWPTADLAREVLMISSGIDPDYGPGPSNPYLDRAIDAARREGVVVHSIYFSSTGHFGHSLWQINWGQNYLSKFAEETGGEFFWLGTSNPVSFAPYLNELNQHFRGQHVLTFLAQGSPGYRRAKIKNQNSPVSLFGRSL